MKTPSRAVVLASALTAVALACQSPTPASPTTGSLPPTDRVAVELSLNGRGVAPIPALCSRGLFLSTHVKNVSTAPVQLHRIALRFESSGGPCQPHTPMVDPTIERSLAPGRNEEVKVFDAAGSLCSPPTGGPSCSWHTTATIFTDAGFAEGVLDFTNSAGGARTGCQGIGPVIFTPRSGAVVSGNVEVTAWDTSKHPNGVYRLRGSQNCRNALGEAVEVTVRN